MIIWLTGNSGAGKSTIANGLKDHITFINLDGDEMRECISSGLSLTPEDRNENNLRIARLASVLSRQQDVVVSVIAPFVATREKINDICQPKWVYIKRKNDYDPERYPYEEGEYDLIINTDELTAKEAISKLLAFMSSEQ